VKLTVIVPMLNEAPTIEPTLRALSEQSDREFDIVFCDNGSDDGTDSIVEQYAAARSLPWVVIREPAKGTGAAADTAAHAAIRRGATHIARTDADCIPSPSWVADIKRAFAESGDLLIAGVSYPRRDDQPISAARAAFLRVVNEVAIFFGKVRRSNHGSQFRGPYMMVSGNNVAFTAWLYLAAGGFTRTAIEDVHEDRALIQTVRLFTDRYSFRRDVVVHASARRIQSWGVARSLLWYAGHYFRPELVDIR
jgi:glycosyltransferase involved in cell wall biosynthesis